MARILILASYAPSLINFRGHLIRELVDRGHEVVAAAPLPVDAAAEARVREGLAERGAQFVEVRMRNAGLNPIREFRTLRDLTNQMRELCPDILLSYTIKPVIWGSLAGRRAGVPAIYSIITGLGYAFMGETLAQKAIGYVSGRLYRRALQCNRKVMFQNPDDRQLFVDRELVAAKKCAVVNGSGVDIEHFAANTPAAEPFVFLMCARLLRDKGVFEYLEAARTVKQRHPKVVFRLLGPFFDNPAAIGPEELKAYTEDGTIEYLGEADDVRPHFIAASVYVLPSYREGTPRTVLEAMATGRAIITTDVPGCRETVREGENGYLVPAKDAAALAEAMGRFVVDPELVATMGRRSRELAEKKYDVRKVNAATLDLLGIEDPSDQAV